MRYVMHVSQRGGTLAAIATVAVMVFAATTHAQTMAPPAMQGTLVAAQLEPLPELRPFPEDSPTPGAATTGEVRTFRGRAEDDLLREIATRPVVRVIERFNSSTLVFHCDLGDGVEMAFKPAREGERDWWIHEIAGYELARALGIVERVPPAVYRRVPRAALEGFLRDANLEVERDGTVEGAAIVWMPVLRRSNLQTPEARAEWSRWLDPEREIPSEHRRRAMQIATLIVFDYLQANFDRWNTANVPLDEHDDLVMRDNNRGWYLQNLRRLNRGGIDGMRRIPASLLAAVERTTGEVLSVRTLRASFRLLNRRQIAGYEARRRALLAHLEDAVQRYGRERVVLDDSDAPVVRTALEVGTTTDTATLAATPTSPTAERTEERHSSRRSQRHRERRRSRHHHRSHRAP